MIRTKKLRGVILWLLASRCGDMEEELPQAVTYISRKDRTWSEQVFLRVHDETGSECVWKSLEARINCHYVNEESLLQPG